MDMDQNFVSSKHEKRVKDLFSQLDEAFLAYRDTVYATVGQQAAKTEDLQTRLEEVARTFDERIHGIRQELLHELKEVGRGEDEQNIQKLRLSIINKKDTL